ncbi:hypothetical protein JQC72_03960 [Polycladomyces sp. WAk]|uniref:Uncharacterized protein n=1 Tax=Polycladomyces zharkentensis TaxID=2807616 RepID=A0ABS2WGP6_9BACL|nr:hypothetical protein [Polycladomyces sp. WAk]MBN2908674.1 hypothetical protein [Polycladomyces sp. WAk]
MDWATIIVALFFGWLFIGVGFVIVFLIFSTRERLRRIGLRILKVHTIITGIFATLVLMDASGNKQEFNSSVIGVAVLFVAPFLFTAFPWLISGEHTDSYITPKERNPQAETFAKKVLLIYSAVLTLAWAFVHIL